MINNGLTLPIYYGYLNWLTIILLYASTLLILCLFKVLLIHKMKKKNIIDFIYEK